MSLRDDRLLDITMLLGAGTPEWPGDTPFDCRWTCALARGASVNLSSITMSPHVGTHADAPLHVRDEWPAADALPLHAFVGPCRVVDVTGYQGVISCKQLALPELGDIPRLLLQTGCSVASHAFPRTWPVLSTDCVDALLRRGLLLLGVDAPSVDERESKSLDVHHHVFAGGAYILENLDLAAITPGDYELLALPMRLEGLDAAPVRAALRPLAAARSSSVDTARDSALTDSA
jgi:arylformamidase